MEPDKKYHQAPDEIWSRINERLDEGVSEQNILNELEPLPRVWGELEKRLDEIERTKGHPNYIWLKVAATLFLVVCLSGIGIYLITQNGESPKQTLVVVENSVPDQASTATSSPVEILAEMHDKSGSHDASIDDLLQELKSLEKDKQILEEHRNQHRSEEEERMLMELELDMADLVRDISNKIRL